MVCVLLQRIITIGSREIGLGFLQGMRLMSEASMSYQHAKDSGAIARIDIGFLTMVLLQPLSRIRVLCIYKKLTCDCSETPERCSVWKLDASILSHE